VIRGTPDILACIRGNFVALELKVEGELSKLQEYNLKKIDEASGLALTATPENWPAILARLVIMAKGKYYVGS
jgi:hypothetical protein